MKLDRNKLSSAAIGRVALLSAFSTAALLAGCGGGDGDTPPIAQQSPNCDTTSIKAAYSSADTEVLLAKSFKKDDLLKLPN